MQARFGELFLLVPGFQGALSLHGNQPSGLDRQRARTRTAYRHIRPRHAFDSFGKTYSNRPLTQTGADHTV
jgi:hypothetical protein